MVTCYTLHLCCGVFTVFILSGYVNYASTASHLFLVVCLLSFTTHLIGLLCWACESVPINGLKVSLLWSIHSPFLLIVVLSIMHPVLHTTLFSVVCLLSLTTHLIGLLLSLWVRANQGIKVSLFLLGYVHYASTTSHCSLFSCKCSFFNNSSERGLTCCSTCSSWHRFIIALRISLSDCCGYVHYAYLFQLYAFFLSQLIW